jgi:hypothetical protein
MGTAAGQTEVVVPGRSGDHSMAAIVHALSRRFPRHGHNRQKGLSIIALAYATELIDFGTFVSSSTPNSIKSKAFSRGWR